MKDYKAKYLPWCKSYEEEVRQLRSLIENYPHDVSLLKKEYQSLTGKRFKRKKEIIKKENLENYDF